MDESIENLVNVIESHTMPSLISVNDTSEMEALLELCQATEPYNPTRSLIICIGTVNLGCGSQGCRVRTD
jgi:hypothetical protein